MALTAAQVADLKDKYQNFLCQFVAFDPITWTVTGITATGAITWQPFCLLSPRFAFTTGASVDIDGSDSYVRPTTGVSTVTFSKSSGDGTVTDNGDKTCTVSYPGGENTGITVVEAVATDAASETATAYAYVYYDASAGNLATIASKIEGFSGSLATGEWQADIVLRADVSAILTNDGRDQPILMHVAHYFDGVANTFGGYKRHANTFVLLCRDSTVRINHSGEYETVLHLETPAYVLKNSRLRSEKNFSTPGNGGDLTTTNLTPTDVAYYFLREATNLHQYFNMSLWNNTSTVDNFNVRADASIWEICQDCHGYNFGMLYFNRWSNLNGKPDPRVRLSDWGGANETVYDGTNPLTTAHMLEYELHRRRTDQVSRVAMQAVLPDMSIIDSGVNIDTVGEIVQVNSLVCTDDTELGAWVNQYGAWLNTEYEIDMRLPMGHELNPGDLFYTAAIDPPGGADTVAASTTWLVDDINYEFDFSRGFWTRKVHAVKISTTGG